MVLNRLRRTSVAVVMAIAVTTVAVPAASAQDCTGTVSASVSAESLPGGAWAVDQGCLTPDSYYEFADGPVLAKAGIADVTYTDGHQGRVAAAVLTLGNGLGLAIVGVEDSATGLIKFGAVLGDFTTDGNRVSVSGEGVALLPVEKASVSASFTGTGTDVSGLLDGSIAELPPTDETPAAPELPTAGTTDQPDPEQPAVTVPDEGASDPSDATASTTPESPGQGNSGQQDPVPTGQLPAEDG